MKYKLKDDEMRYSFLAHILSKGRFKFNDTIKKNIRRVYAHESDDKLNKFHNAILTHHLRILKELLLIIFFGNLFFKRKFVQFKGLNNLVQCLEQNKGVIILTGHFYNWEWLALMYKKFSYLNQNNTDKKNWYVIRKKLRFSLLTKLFFSFVMKSNLKIVERDKAILKAISILKNKNVLIFPFDLKPKDKDKKAISTLFLGCETLSYSSLAYLVKKTGCAVIPSGYYLINDSLLGVEFYPEIHWAHSLSFEQEIIDNTNLYNRALEKIILKRPVQWNWLYRRW